MEREAAPPGALDGLRVVTFESRRAEELRRMLERHGAAVTSAPALREVPLDDNPAALEMVTALEDGRVDVAVFLTGVGTQALVEAVGPRCSSERLAELLGRAKLVARGPKPVAALRRLGLVADVLAPEPNTWCELIRALDAALDVRGRRVWVQEYGRENPELLAALAQRGAEVHRVPVYRWALPEDTRPLEAAIQDLLAGRAEVAVFTTAVQVDHLFRVAGGRATALSAALRDGVVVAAIGPTAAAALASREISADLVASPPKLGPLVAMLARDARECIAVKQGGRSLSAAPASDP